MPHVVRRATGPSRRWSSWAAGRPGWRRPGSRGSAGTRSCCSRPPTGSAGRSTSPPRRPARGDHRHHRLAGGRGSSILGVEVRLNSYAETDDVLALGPDVVVVATGGTAQHRLPGGRRGPGHHRLGRAGRLRRALRARSCSTTTTASTRGPRPRWRWRSAAPRWRSSRPTGCSRSRSGPPTPQLPARRSTGSA